MLVFYYIERHTWFQNCFSINKYLPLKKDKTIKTEVKKFTIKILLCCYVFVHSNNKTRSVKFCKALFSALSAIINSCCYICMSSL